MAGWNERLVHDGFPGWKKDGPIVGNFGIKIIRA
jgi:hypothetical protein